MIIVAAATFSQLQLPARAPTLVIVLVILDFPVALMPAWAFEARADEDRSTPVRLYSMGVPDIAGARRRPEHRQLVVDMHLLGSWRAYGGADACRPLGNDEFTCD